MRNNLLFQGEAFDPDAAHHGDFLNPRAVNDRKLDPQRLGQDKRVAVNPGDFKDPDAIRSPRTMVANQLVPTRRGRGLDTNAIPDPKARGTLHAEAPVAPNGISHEGNLLPCGPCPATTMAACMVGAGASIAAAATFTSNVAVNWSPLT